MARPSVREPDIRDAAVAREPARPVQPDHHARREAGERDLAPALARQVPVDAVRVSDISKRFGQHRALAGVSLELRAGSVCALLGPNGAGKSTLLGIVSSLVRPSKGKVTFRAGGTEQPLGRGLRAQIGVLAHSAFVYGQLTGIENLLFWARLYDVPDARARADALLCDVGLDERARARPAGTYSRGMLQRLALARALLHDPRILLLDEPFTGLDRTGATALSRALADARARARIVLVVTHDVEFIGGIADHVAVLRRGKLVYEDRRAAGEPAGDDAGHAGGAGSAGFGADELKALYHEYTE